MIVGPDNDASIQWAVAEADVCVAAWGNPTGIARATYDRRIATVLHLVGDAPLAVVGRPTRQGYPLHGPVWNADPPLAAWPGAGNAR